MLLRGNAALSFHLRRRALSHAAEGERSIVPERDLALERARQRREKNAKEALSKFHSRVGKNEKETKTRPLLFSRGKKNQLSPSPPHPLSLSFLFHESPTTDPSSAMSMLKNPGLVGKPGMVCISPTSATKNPAPALGRSSLIGMTKPDGAPLALGSAENEYWVLAMQIGSLPKPCLSNFSAWAFASGESSTPLAP